MDEAGRADPAAGVGRLASLIRLDAARMVSRHGLGYLGQAASAAELVAAVFRRLRPDVDSFVCSPGHYVIAVYAAAARTSRLDPALLATYGDDGALLEAIGTERTPGVDMTCGSLGQGLSAAAGLALADRLAGATGHPRAAGRVYALLSDGELEEGQVWEAAMFAAHHRLDRLTVLLDCNNSQVDGPVDSITTIEPVAAKWAAFGWATVEVDGNDPAAVLGALDAAADADRPAVVVARTSVRRGLAALPADADGHFITLRPDLADRLVADLATATAAPAAGTAGTAGTEGGHR
jgi:transketolase